MTSPIFDSDGYPTDETMDAIAKWSHSDPDGWFSFCRNAWNHHYGKVKNDYKTITFITGGWSGNEAIIEAMQENKVLWIVLWESSHRGGKYVFRLPEENR